MDKREIYEKLEDMIKEGSITPDFLINRLVNWLPSNELNEFVEYLEDEIMY